jgi:hypothetical protein
LRFNVAKADFLPTQSLMPQLFALTPIFRTVFWADFFVDWLVVLLVARTFHCGQEAIRHKRLPSRATRGSLPIYSVCILTSAPRSEEGYCHFSGWKSAFPKEHFDRSSQG